MSGATCLHVIAAGHLLDLALWARPLWFGRSSAGVDNDVRATVWNANRERQEPAASFRKIEICSRRQNPRPNTAQPATAASTTLPPSFKAARAALVASVRPETTANRFPVADCVCMTPRTGALCRRYNRSTTVVDQIRCHKTAFSFCRASSWIGYYTPNDRVVSRDTTRSFGV